MTARLENHKSSVNDLFTIPLIFAAALLSFAHGANDVANAVGPLAGINEAIVGGGVSTKAAIPIWVMAVGAIGISLGLALYGPKLIRTVGSEITELDKMRAFCIAMAAAITVIIASQLGLPVSSTHIAVGGVFGVGFLREYIKSSYARMLDEIRDAPRRPAIPRAVEEFLAQFEAADVATKGEMLREHEGAGVQRPAARKAGTKGPWARAPGRTGQAQPAAAHRGGLDHHGSDRGASCGDVLLHDPWDALALTGAREPSGRDYGLESPDPDGSAAARRDLKGDGLIPSQASLSSRLPFERQVSGVCFGCARKDGQ